MVMYSKIEKMRVFQKQKQEFSFLAYFSMFLEGFFIDDWIDLVETVLVLTFSSCGYGSLRTKNFMPVFETVCLASKLGRSLICLPFFLEA